jgi:hypothetical protein
MSNQKHGFGWIDPNLHLSEKFGPQSGDEGTIGEIGANHPRNLRLSG